MFCAIMVCEQNSHTGTHASVALLYSKERAPLTLCKSGSDCRTLAGLRYTLHLALGAPWPSASAHGPSTRQLLAAPLLLAHWSTLCEDTHTFTGPETSRFPHTGRECRLHSCCTGNRSTATKGITHCNHTYGWQHAALSPSDALDGRLWDGPLWSQRSGCEPTLDGRALSVLASAQ